MKHWVFLLLCICMLLSACNADNTAVPSSSNSSSLSTILPTAPTKTPASLEMGNHEDLGYMLYVPPDPQENMPMIVYLHGSSDQGTDPQVMLTHAGFPRSLISGELGQVKAYVLMPQLGRDKTGWEQTPEALISLVDKIVADKKINATKISLTGHGMGGTGVWQIAVKYPDKFSCFVPMSGNAPLTEQNLTTLKNAKIWAFVGSADTVIDPQHSIRFADALKAANPQCRLTILDGYTHNQVPDAYRASEYNVVLWMIDQ